MPRKNLYCKCKKMEKIKLYLEIRLVGKNLYRHRKKD